jgi:hypothetical protein
MNTAQMVPAPKVRTPAAVGTWTATLKGGVLRWKLTYSKLSSKGLAAHLHYGPRGKRGGFLLALICSPCHSGTTGSASLTAPLQKVLLQGKTYVDLHTQENRTGEIRGQVLHTLG